MCLNTSIIVNPAYVKATGTGKYPFVHMAAQDYPYQRNFFVPFDYKFFSPRRNYVTSKNIDSFYAYDPCTGDTIPVYIEVECGRCKSCIQKKRTSLKHRMILEQSCYDEPPVFLTLTYDDGHLPSCGVSVRDVQLFMKRLRSYVSYHHSNFPRFRYICFSEYGKQHGRPHYHLLLFGLGFSSPRDVLLFEKDMHTCWQNGFVYAKLCDHGCFNYVSKYVCKGSNVPFGKNPNFRLSSRKNGGIGMPAFENPTVYSQVLRSPHPTIKLKCLGKVFDVYIPKSIRDSLFRSPRQFYSPRVLTRFKRFCWLSQLLRSLYDSYDYVVSRIDGLTFMGNDCLRSLIGRESAIIPKEIYDRFAPLECVSQQIVVPGYMLEHDVSYFKKHLSSLIDEYLNLYEYLLNVTIDFDKLYSHRYLRSKIVNRWKLSLIKFAEENSDFDALSISEFNAIIVQSQFSKDLQ